LDLSRVRPGLTRRAFIRTAAAATLLAASGDAAKVLAEPGGGANGSVTTALKSAKQTLFRVPRSIPADGSLEVTRALNDWITSVPNGVQGNPSVLQFGNGATYWTDGTVLVTGKQWVTVAGGDSTFERRTPSATRFFPHWMFQQCDQYQWNGIHVRGEADPTVGYNATLEAQHAFVHQGSTASTSQGCSADGVWGDAINVCCDSSGRPSAHHTIGGFTSGTVHRQGVSITTGDDIAFSGCAFGFCWRSAVDLEPNSSAGFATNILFEDCSWVDHHLNWFAAGAPQGVVENVTFRRCSTPSNLAVVVGKAWSTYAGHGRRANLTFEDCSGLLGCGNPQGALMQFHYVDGFVTVTNVLNPLQASRTPPMRIARFDDYTTANAVITYSGNTPDLG
jgi:hypothetical protein